jgi:hypothetical protein
MQVQCFLHLLPCTRQDVIRLLAKHSALKVEHFFCSRRWYSILHVVKGCRQWRNVNLVSHKDSQEKSSGVRSGDRGGQEVDRPRPINRSGNCLFRYVFTSLWICGGTPSCWETFALSWSCWCINCSCSMSVYVSRHLTSVLCSSGRSWDNFLGVLAKKLICSLHWCAFQFLCGFYFLSNKYM